MPRGRRLGAEQIVPEQRQIEILQGQGKSLVACKEAGTTEQSFYRWRKEFGGLNVDQARCCERWLSRLGTKSLYIEPGSPWENGYCESFDGKLRDECLNG